MHVLHLVVVRASDAESAETVVDDVLMDFGTENNYHSICGSVSEDDEVSSTGEGYYNPKEEGLDSIEKINKKASEWCGMDNFDILGGDDCNTDAYNYNGVTQFDDYEDGKKYVVFVDMHE